MNLCKTSHLKSWILGACLVASWGPIAAAGTYRIARQGETWQLLSDGEPFHIKGAVGWAHFDVLHDYGGNAIRAGANKRDLDDAHAHQLRVMAGLPVRGARNGLNWGDAQRVAEQKQEVLDVVRRLKDHPALMLWVVGNELDWIPPGRPYHPQLWQRLNDLAIAIHEADPHHPVLTVIGTSRFEEKIQQIAAAMPDMDLLGINAYGDLAEVTRWTRQYWSKPYVVAEWGPTGHWQMPRTPWHVPLEQTSSEKAQAIMQRYQQIIQGDQQNCLGSFVFLWGQKQETTHTWYGMFQDGRLTESVDVMKYLWTGAWPENRSPALKSLTIQGCDDPQAVYLEPTRGCQAVVECLDPDGDQLAYEWDIRPEVEIPANSYAGGGEKAVKPIAGLIEDPTLARIRFKAPATPGPYRLFVRVLDGHNHVAYANVPFLVQ